MKLTKEMLIDWIDRPPSNSDLDFINKIIELEKRVEQYENTDDLTLFYMWLDAKAKDKMKQLENNRDKAIEQCNDWIKIYKKLNSDERIILRLEEISRTLKGDSD